MNPQTGVQKQSEVTRLVKVWVTGKRNKKQLGRTIGGGGEREREGERENENE